jgi:ABC-type transport system involved in multi-copper enzyme maturation permease subunit
MRANTAGALIILLGILVMVTALALSLFIPDPHWIDWIVLVLMFIVGLGATVGGSELL